MSVEQDRRKFELLAKAAAQQQYNNAAIRRRTAGQLRRDYLAGRIEAEEYEQELDRLLEVDPAALDRTELDRRTAERLVRIGRQRGLSARQINMLLTRQRLD